MTRWRPLLLVAGAVMAAMGLLWIGQGLGHVRWPSWSVMLGDPAWANRGVVLAVAGLVLILVARRLPRRQR